LPIQLVAAHNIHYSQALTLDCLTFNPTGVTKHGLTYIALSRVCLKEKNYLFSRLLIKIFQVDHLVQEAIFQLKTNAQYKLAIVFLKSYHLEFLIVKSFEDILTNSNLLTSHILCLNEMRIKECSFKLTKLECFITKVPCIIML
jgi:hypothetical protein